jgi:hypothetical protein
LLWPKNNSEFFSRIREFDFPVMGSNSERIWFGSRGVETYRNLLKRDVVEGVIPLSPHSALPVCLLFDIAPHLPEYENRTRFCAENGDQASTTRKLEVSMAALSISRQDGSPLNCSPITGREEMNRNLGVVRIFDPDRETMIWV